MKNFFKLLLLLFMLTACAAPSDKPSEVSTDISLTNPMPGMGPAATTLNIPTGHPGYWTRRVQNTSERPAPSDGSGAFRTTCEYSHMNFDDPILYPGRPGAAHLHTFFGNKGTNAYSTASSIATTGASTCLGGVANRSAYWVPTLLDAKGQPVLPSNASIYYKTGYNVPPARIKAMPAGLRMIAGDMRSSSTQQHAFWNCGHKHIGSLGSIPNATMCDGAGNEIMQTIIFPQCWNDRDLDSSDHKSHMAYATNGTCPSGYPVALPEITINVRYKIPSSGTTGWRLSSDMYDRSKPGGFSNHGDWFNGWEQHIVNLWVKNCDNDAKDCHGHLLGLGSDGQYKMLY
jgi:hypothetical protein